HMSYMMLPKTRKAQKKKETAEVPLTVGSKSTQNILKGGPSLRTELSSRLKEVHLGSCEVWVKYRDVLQPTRVFFKGIVDDLKSEIKEKLPNQFGDIDVNQITLKRHGEEMDLCTDFIIDQKFLTIFDTLLQVIVNTPVSRKHLIDNIAIEELKHEIKYEINDTIKKSKEAEAQQIDEVREIKNTNVLLTGGGDIAIGPSQAIGELLLVDNRSALNLMTVLTNCNDFWMILYIIKNDNINYIVRCSVNRSLALAIIKQFVIEERNWLNKWVGKSATYISGDTIEPFRKKAKLTEHMTEEIDERMELMIDDMSEEELSKMKACEKLRIVRKFCKLDEQLYIDQIISQLSDNYEHLTDQYRQVLDSKNSHLLMLR
ncbi:23732_t:CDS:2, partial [Gigaspora margarita]